MRWLWMVLAASLGVCWAPTAEAHELKCVGERIEKGSSTWGYARSVSSGFRIEKGSSTVGWAKQRNSDWAIESSGSSTLGWLKGDRIETSGGSTWARLADAQEFADSCPAPVAAALWVLEQKDKI